MVKKNTNRQIYRLIDTDRSIDKSYVEPVKKVDIRTNFRKVNSELEKKKNPL